MPDDLLVTVRAKLENDVVIGAHEVAELLNRCERAEHDERKATRRAVIMEEECSIGQLKMDELRAQIRLLTAQGHPPVERRKIWQGRRELDAV